MDTIIEIPRGANQIANDVVALLPKDTYDIDRDYIASQVLSKDSMEWRKKLRNIDIHDWIYLSKEVMQEFIGVSGEGDSAKKYIERIPKTLNETEYKKITNYSDNPLTSAYFDGKSKPSSKMKHTLVTGGGLMKLMQRSNSKLSNGIREYFVQMIQVVDVYEICFMKIRELHHANELAISLKQCKLDCKRDSDNEIALVEYKSQKAIEQCIADEKQRDDDRLKKQRSEDILAAFPLLIDPPPTKAFIYVSTTNAYRKDGIYKIGRTTNVESRLCSYNTMRVYADKAEICAQYEVYNVDAVETLIHKHFDRFRCKKKKELYQVLPEMITTYIESIVNINNEAHINEQRRIKEMHQAYDTDTFDVNILIDHRYDDLFTDDSKHDSDDGNIRLTVDENIAVAAINRFFIDSKVNYDFIRDRVKREQVLSWGKMKRYINNELNQQLMPPIETKADFKAKWIDIIKELCEDTFVTFTYTADKKKPST